MFALDVAALAKHSAQKPCRLPAVLHAGVQYKHHYHCLPCARSCRLNALTPAAVQGARPGNKPLPEPGGPTNPPAARGLEPAGPPLPRSTGCSHQQRHDPGRAARGAAAHAGAAHGAGECVQPVADVGAAHLHCGGRQPGPHLGPAAAAQRAGVAACCSLHTDACAYVPRAPAFFCVLPSAQRNSRRSHHAGSHCINDRCQHRKAHMSALRRARWSQRSATRRRQRSWHCSGARRARSTLPSHLAPPPRSCMCDGRCGAHAAQRAGVVLLQRTASSYMARWGYGAHRAAAMLCACALSVACQQMHAQWAQPTDAASAAAAAPVAAGHGWSASTVPCNGNHAP